MHLKNLAKKIKDAAWVVLCKKFSLPEVLLRLPWLRQQVIRYFNILYYQDKIFDRTFWMGHALQKHPADAFIIQEIITEKKPDVIIECGTYQGASALFMASVSQTQVISIDIAAQKNLPAHPRVRYLTGSSADPKTLTLVKNLIQPNQQVMVLLDSLHTKEQVEKELQLYAPLVSPGQYLVVEDTNLHGHPVLPFAPPGPMEALAEFLPAHPEFSIDKSREKFHTTFNPSGYLLKC